MSDAQRDARLGAIAADTWNGRGRDLLALLADDDPHVRSAAAVRIGELLYEPDVGLPDERALFETLREHDALHPGVADAFWTTVVYKVQLDDSFDHDALKTWTLAVLEARAGRPHELSPVPGNNLEFYAHELFDKDPDALWRLLSAGYVNVVHLALDHPGALPAEHTVPLIRALFARTKDLVYAEYLAIEHGVVLDEARPRWPSVDVGGARALLLSRSSYRRLWIAHWLIFDVPAPSLATAAYEVLLARLVDAGVPLGPYEADLDPEVVRRVTGVAPRAGTTRAVRRPRADLQVDLAVTPSGDVAALRVVQAQRPVG